MHCLVLALQLRLDLGETNSNIFIFAAEPPEALSPTDTIRLM
jgi:hypothetical protein